MRAIFCILLLAVIFQGAVAVSSRSMQRKMLLERINNTMEKSVLGRAMKNMVSLASKLNSSYDDLEEAFNQLKSNLSNRLIDENKEFTDLTTTHVDSVSTLTTNIDNTKASIAVDVQAEKDINAKLSDNKVSLNNYVNQSSDAQKDLSNARTERSNLIDAHDKEVQDYNSANGFISQAIGDLAAANQSQSEAGLGEFSFVQVRETVSSFIQKMQSTTSAMRGSHQLFIRPVILAMSHMQTSEDNNAINTAIKALVDLKAYFVTALDVADRIFSDEKDRVNNRINTLVAQINVLEEQLIPATKKIIADLEDSFRILDEKLTKEYAALVISEDDLVAENASFEKSTNIHNAVTSKINSELNVVIQAQNIVNDAKNEQAKNN